MSAALAEPLSFLLQTLGGLYILAVLLRFLLQLVRADFYNPISQLVVKATNPLLIPLRRLIPSVGKLDSASFVLALLLQMLLTYLVLALYGIWPHDLSPLAVLSGAVFALIFTILNVYMFGIFIIAIASWVAPGSYNPALMLLNQLVEPIASRVRNVIPPMGGLDFSVMVILIGIYMIKSYLIVPVMFSLVPPVILQVMMLF